MILKQFDGAAVAPRDDAILYNAIIKKNGVFKGVEITHIGSNQLHITAGHGILKGRVWEQEEETIHCNLATSGTLKGRAYIHMDLTDMDTPIKIMTVAAASLPELIQDEDCNYTNGIYEMELCTYDVTDLAISNLEVTYNNISEILPIIGKMEDLAALTESGYVADALLVSQLNKNMGGCVLSIESDGAYITYTQNGETVKKKLGSGEIKRTQIASGRLGRQDGTNHSITASAVNIEGYESMTADNFSIELETITGRTSSGTNCSAKITKSYDASTGTLTVSVSHSGSDGLAFVSATIYCYHNE